MQGIRHTADSLLAGEQNFLLAFTNLRLSFIVA